MTRRAALVLVAALAPACGPPALAPAPPLAPAPTLVPRLLFTAEVPVGRDEVQLYVVLDESWSADATLAGTPIEIGDDGTTTARTRAVDPASLPAAAAHILASTIETDRADCRGALGPPVELTLEARDAEGAPRPLATALAAPLQSPCTTGAVAAWVTDHPPARVYRYSTDDEEPDEATTALLVAALHQLPRYAAHQAEIEAELCDEEDACTIGPWDQDLLTIELLDDGAGHRLAQVNAGDNDYLLIALFEDVNGAYVRRADDDGEGLGPAFDVEGDGTIETMSRVGLVRDGEIIRHFTRGPFVPGC